jgi:phage virion morphogenesis protein
MFTIQVDNQSVLSALSSLAAKAGDMRTVLDEIGEKMVDITKTSFGNEASPWGAAWAPRHKDTGRKILTGETGRLQDSIYHTLVGDDTVEIGDPMVYAAIHQFGGTIRPREKKALAFGGGVFASVTMPARPYMPFSQDGQIAPVAERAILDIVQNYLEG